MLSSTPMIALLCILLTLTAAQDSSVTPHPALKNITIAQAIAQIAAKDPRPEISEVASLAAATPTGTPSTACQCVNPGLWCGTRSGNATLNAIVNGDYDGTDPYGVWNGTHEEGPHSHNETHHDGAWNETRPEDYPQGKNGTHHDGDKNGTDSDDHHHNVHRLQGLNGTCDWSTIYYCPENSTSATNSLPCAQSQGKTKHCRELPFTFYDVCV